MPKHSPVAALESEQLIGVRVPGQDQIDAGVHPQIQQALARVLHPPQLDRRVPMLGRALQQGMMQREDGVPLTLRLSQPVGEPRQFGLHARSMLARTLLGQPVDDAIAVQREDAQRAMTPFPMQLAAELGCLGVHALAQQALGVLPGPGIAFVVKLVVADRDQVGQMSDRCQQFTQLVELFRVAPILYNVARVEDEQDGLFAVAGIEPRDVRNHRLPFSVGQRTLIPVGDELKAALQSPLQSLQALVRRRVPERLHRSLRTLRPEASRRGGRNPKQDPKRGQAAACMLGMLALGSAMAQDAPRPSHWGDFPARVEADSLLLRSQPRARAAWEWPLYVPYRIVRFPFSLLMDGTEAGIVFLDESRTIYRARRLFGAIDLPYGFRLSGVADRLIGGGVGADFYHDRFFADDMGFQLKTQWTSKGQTRLSIGLRSDRRKPWQHEWGAAYRKRPRARYFAPDSDLESFYIQELGWAGFQLSHRQGESSTLQAGAVFSHVATRAPSPDDGISISDPARYADRLPTGFGESSEGAEFNLDWVRDTTSQRDRPSAGGIQRLGVAWFAPKSDDASFWTSRAEVQQFWPLWHRRTLGLRLVGSLIDAGHERPHFARLYTNDDPDQMRGFDDFRFRGRGMVLWNLEYRYPIWSYRSAESTGLDFCLFQDGGQFFDRREELGLRSLEFSHGFGIRFIGARGFGARFDVGFSDEDVVLRLSTDQVFQYARYGLYHGRSPIPLR